MSPPTLIQNAAHEDANIIFGAVLDEKMGDEVKITVIATGFRQDQMGRKRTSQSDSMVPHVSLQGRPSVPRFASEESAEEELKPIFESRKLADPAPSHHSSRRWRSSAVHPSSPAGHDRRGTASARGQHGPGENGSCYANLLCEFGGQFRRAV